MRSISDASTWRSVIVRNVNCSNAMISSRRWRSATGRWASSSLPLAQQCGGVAMPPHCCASGKLLLAHLPVADRQRLLEIMALEQFTLRTITDRQVLASEMDRIVSAGYAVDNEEYVLGVACVAVPVRNKHAEVIASLAVQGATARLPLMRAIEFVPRLQAAAADIGSTFG